MEQWTIWIWNQKTWLQVKNLNLTCFIVLATKKRKKRENTKKLFLDHEEEDFDEYLEFEPYFCTEPSDNTTSVKQEWSFNWKLKLQLH